MAWISLQTTVLTSSSFAGSVAPIYSKEYLSELKANTLSTPNSKGSTPVPDYDSSFDISMDQSGFLADMSEIEDKSSACCLLGHTLILIGTSCSLGYTH